MTIAFHPKLISLSAALLCLLSSPAGAAIITNGGFESGFSGWTRADQPGGDGTFALQTGTASPVTATLVPPPPGGTTAAMTDAGGPGSHVLYQDFTLAAAVPAATLVFDLFIGNRAGLFVSPNSLDFSTPALNQQVRVDILLASASPFSVAPADVLMNVFQTHPGDPSVSGYSHQSVDVSALLNGHVGTTLRLRFAETDNVFAFQAGVDNVDFALAAVPEPGSWTLALSTLLALGLARRVFALSRLHGLLAPPKS